MNYQQTYQTSNRNNNINFPDATAVLIDVGDDEQQEHPPSGSGSRDVYASAHVVDNNLINQLPIAATESQVDAIPLDPWSKERTASTEESSRGQPETATRHETSRMANNIPIGLTSAMLEHPQHKKLRRRRRREARMVVSGTTGFIVGTLFLGPVGGILIGATSAGITKSVNKIAERRKDKKVMRQFQKMQGQYMVTQGQHLI